MEDRELQGDLSFVIKTSQALNLSIRDPLNTLQIKILIFAGGMDNRTMKAFLPCSMIVCQGEDIIEKITSFCENCSCNTFIASAVGSVSCASIKQCDNAAKYEGTFIIVSLSGNVSVSLNPGGSNGNKVAITLAGNNGSVFGG